MKAGRRNVARACVLLKVSRAAFYAHLSGPSRREQQDAGLTGQIRDVHEDSRGRYRAPRIHAELRRLMRAAGIRGRALRRWRKTTIADPAAASRADRIRHDFTADASKINARWCGDITYVGTWKEWLYLATVIDIASLRVAGYAIADHLRTELVADVLANAVAARNPQPGVIFDSDRGRPARTPRPSSPPSPTTPGVAAGRAHRPMLGQRAFGIVFASIKGELLDLQAWPTPAMGRRAIVGYLAWYNGTRLHSTLGYRSPAEFE